jgi:predicted enzyme related to lactoylglutathione lyase
MTMIKRLKFAAIPVTDQDRALQFYTEKLGFTIFSDQPFSDEQRWIELGMEGADTRVVLFTADGYKSMIGGFSNLTFASDDVEKTYEDLSARGVEFLGPPEKQAWGTFALFKDPDGTTFCLSSK